MTRANMRVAMLVVLLLPLRARADWVEIAQNTYRRTSLKKQHATEFTPEYPNVTLGGPDWRRGYVHRAGDVRRVPPAPRRPPPAVGAGADHKQEYYDIDDPDELNVHDEVPSSAPDRLDLAVNVNHNSDEGNRRRDTIPTSEAGQTENLKQSTNPQQTEFQVEQSQYRKGQSVDRDRKREPSGVDHLSFNKIMQHFINTLSKPDERVYNDSKTNDVEVDIKNTLTQGASSGDSFRNNDSQEHTDSHRVSLDNDKHFSGVLKMFQTVAKIITKNTHRTVTSKIKYLEDLKNKLLYNIQERIDSVWPAAGRVARGSRGTEARGHMDLPSSEGALMTISFLTFAVFLIKLVLQIIHTYKNKTMMMTPAVVTAVGRAVASAAATLPKN